MFLTFKSADLLTNLEAWDDRTINQYMTSQVKIVDYETNIQLSACVRLKKWLYLKKYWMLDAILHIFLTFSSMWNVAFQNLWLPALDVYMNFRRFLCFWVSFCSPGWSWTCCALLPCLSLQGLCSVVWATTLGAEDVFLIQFTGFICS